MQHSSELDRDVSFWLNVFMFDAAVTGICGSPLVGDSTWWGWYEFTLVFVVFLLPCLWFVQGIWWALHEHGGR